MLHTKHNFSITREICKRKRFLNLFVWGLFLYMKISSFERKRCQFLCSLKLKNNKKREYRLIPILGSDMKERSNPKEIRAFSKAEFFMELLFYTGIYWILSSRHRRMPMSTPQNGKMENSAVDGLPCPHQKIISLQKAENRRLYSDDEDWGCMDCHSCEQRANCFYKFYK